MEDRERDCRMTDLIKREDAIKAVDAFLGTDSIVERIKRLPSADRPQGEWIDEADKYDASFGIHDYRCSNCNSYADEYIGGHEWYTAGKPNFCPYCGADMRERKESER